MFKTKKVSADKQSPKLKEKSGAKGAAKKKALDKKAAKGKPKISTLRSGELKGGVAKSVGPKQIPSTPGSRSLLRMAAKVGIKPGANKDKAKVTQLGKRGVKPTGRLKAPVVREAPAPVSKLSAEHPSMLAAQAAVDKKAVDITLLDVAAISGLCDHMLLCTARSTTHLSAVADGIEEALRKSGQRLIHSDGRRTAEPEWVLLDYGDLMVHVFRTQARVDYQLEEYYSAGNVLARFEHS